MKKKPEGQIKKPKAERDVEKLEIELEQARKKLSDATLKQTWDAVTLAANLLERRAIMCGGLTSPRNKFLVTMASDMRKTAERDLGPQPGYGPTKTVPK